MLPVAPVQLRGPFQRHARNRASAIAEARGPRETDDRKHATRPHKFPHTADASFSIDVMKHRYRRDQIEGAILQREGEEVVDDKACRVACTAVGSSSANARRIRVQAGDEQPAVGDVERQQTVAASNIESGASEDVPLLVEVPVVIPVFQAAV